MTWVSAFRKGAFRCAVLGLSACGGDASSDGDGGSSDDGSPSDTVTPPSTMEETCTFLDEVCYGGAMPDADVAECQQAWVDVRAEYEAAGCSAEFDAYEACWVGQFADAGPGCATVVTTTGTCEAEQAALEACDPPS